jgi:hypothetical protein
MVQLLILILVIGVVLWLVNSYVPMADPWKTIFNVVVVLVFIIYLLRYAGLF